MLDRIILATSSGKVYYKDKYTALDSEDDVLKENNVFESELEDKIKNSDNIYWFNNIFDDKTGVYIGWHYSTYGSDIEEIAIVALNLDQTEELIEKL